MTTYVLIPGAGGESWNWHLVTEQLVAAGHTVIAPDLPATDDRAGLGDYVDVVIAAIDHAGEGGATSERIVVGHSLGGFVAPLVCAKRPARLLVLVAPMIPRPGESGGEWWEATGQPAAAAAAAKEWGGSEEFDPIEVFLHDLPPDVLQEAMQRPVEQSDGPFRDPWPLSQWPDVLTRVVACRYDRLFPLPFVRQLSRDRLGIEADVIDTGHLPALADPAALTDLLEHYRRQLLQDSSH